VLIGHDRFGQGAGRWFGSIPRVLKLVMLSPFVSQMPTPNLSMPDKKDQMVVLKELLEAGKITPVIDRTYPLSELPEAIRYLGKREMLEGKSSSPCESNPKALFTEVRRRCSFGNPIRRQHALPCALHDDDARSRPRILDGAMVRGRWRRERLEYVS
jgi:hypothetical protein